MNAQKLIIDWMRKVFSNIQGINLKYAYDDISETHLVEITPAEIEGSEEFAKVAYEFEREFFQLFPNEDLLISEPRPFKNMSNIIYSLEQIILQEEINEMENHYEINIPINYSYSCGSGFSLAA